MRRETSALRSAAFGNKLSGTLPAALGALTDLVELCARSPPIPRGGEGPARPRSAESVRSRARAVRRSYLDSNGFTGTIGSWIGSLAKLTYLYARALACMVGYRGSGACALLRRALLGVLEYSAAWGLRCDLRVEACVRAHCVCVCVCVLVFVRLLMRVVSTAHTRMHAMRAHACAAWPCVCVRARTCAWYGRRVLHEGVRPRVRRLPQHCAPLAYISTYIFRARMEHRAYLK
jgi:hypothetical protein